LLCGCGGEFAIPRGSVRSRGSAGKAKDKTWARQDIDALRRMLASDVVYVHSTAAAESREA